MELTDREKAAYIAAFIDGEGHIGLSTVQKNGRPYYTREITFVNTDKVLFDAVAQMCRDLGFPLSVYFVERRQPNNQNQWHGRISGSKEAYIRFAEMIPLQAPRKRQRLQDIINSYQDKAVLGAQRRTGRNVACAHCGGVFYLSPSEKSQFCSRACDAASRRRRVTRSCETCGITFEVIRSFSQRRFCSRTCAGKSRAEWWAGIGRSNIVKARAAKYRKRGFTDS